MKNLIVGLCLLMSSVSFGQDETSKPFGLLVGGGIGTPVGILGIEARKFLHEEWSVSGTFAADILGPQVTVGGEYYVKDSDKCFFFFSCRDRMYLGASIGRASGGKVTSSTTVLTGSNAGQTTEATYKQGDSYFVSPRLGWYSIFPSGFTFNLELAYRFAWKKPTYTIDQGQYDQEDVDRIERFAGDSLGLGLAIGWTF